MKNLSSRGLVCRLSRPLAAWGLLLATAGAAHAQTRAATFAPAATYGTGANSNPISVVAADVNGDSQLDLLTANYGNGTAGVLLGSGNSTFQPIVTYSLGSNNPYDIAVADVDGDGQLDLLTANYGSGTAGVLLGNGNGTFKPIVSYSAGPNNAPAGIAVADVNGDGQLDLLTANSLGNSAGVLLGNGNGTFQPAVTYGTGGRLPRSIAVADVNGDGQLDLLLTNEFSASAGVLLGNGNGTFQPAVTYGTGGSNPTSIAVADVNGDGQLDLLTANNTNGTTGVLLGNGNGTFQPAATYGTGGSYPQTIAVADVNGDGRLDLLLTNGDNGTTGVLLGDGPGTFQPAVTYGTGGSRPYGLVAADVNGDGKPDLLTTNFGTNTAAVLLNTTVYAPIINAVIPITQYIGQSITLTGTNLTGATAVRFNGTPATFVVVSATTIRATIPAGVRPAVGNFDRVTVTTPNGTSNAAPFTILANAPTVSTNTPSGLSATSATLGGNVTTDGGADISDRGVVYSSTNSFPFLGDPGVSQQTMGMGTGPFSQLITGLTPGTTYYVRAYATNRSGTGYGNPGSFTTACQVPVLTQLPSSQTVAAEPGQCTASVSFQAQASGVPAPTFTYTLSGAPVTSPYTFPLGQSTVTVTATNCGGSVTGTFTVTVKDTQAPVVRTQNVTVALVNGQATITAAQVNNGSSDNCTIKSVTVSPNTFNCANSGANQVTLTVTDASGNVSTGPATVTVTGSVPQPAISVSPSSTIYLGYGPQSATLIASGGGGGATYQWSPATGLSTTTSSTTTFTATAAGKYPITVTVTSASGCSATVTVTLTVVEARCGNKNDKVVVCHNGQALCVAAAAVDAHLGHGDQLGNCSSKTSAARTQAVASSALSPEPDLTPLLEAYPNPFTTSATVRFRADQDGAVRVVVYNVLGQPVATLYDGAAQAGQVVERTLAGIGLSAGLYTIRLSGAGGQALSQRLMLSK